MSTKSGNISILPFRDAMGSIALRFQTACVFAAACLAIILYALVPATTRIAAVQLDGLSIGLIRTVGAGLVSLPLLFALRLRPPQRPRDWGLLLLYGFGNFAAFPILFSVGTQRTSGAHAALIMAVMPLIVGLIGMVLDRRLPRWTWFVGAAIAVIGETALVGMRNMGDSAGAAVAGDAIVFAACSLSAVGIVAGARLSSRMNPFSASLWAIAIAGVGFAPFAAMHLAAAPYEYAHLSGTTCVAILHITLGAAVMANVAWLWAVVRGGLVRIAPIQFAQPVCALFFACTLLGERVTASLLLVAFGIVFGSITACRAARPISNQKAILQNVFVAGRQRLASVALQTWSVIRGPELAVKPATDPASRERRNLDGLTATVRATPSTP
jgi:drug/metabolite transporter (DMT)-like permease